MDVSSQDVRPRWLWVASIWTAVALFDATQTVFGMRAEGMHHAWLHLFLTVFLAWLPWIPATPLVLHFAQRFPLSRAGIVTSCLAHAALVVCLDVVYSIWNAALYHFFNPYMNSSQPAFPLAWFRSFYGGMLASFLLYGAILAIGRILEARERLARQQTETARLNEQLSKAQLDALRRQIEPHFLFNTLNSLTGLIREGRTEDAVTMTVRLSDFLRRTFEESKRQQVPLAQEVDFARKYLDIQKIRYADRLDLSVDVPAELLSAQVPCLLLQPMVENAVKHGIAQRIQGGAIRVSANRSNGTLTLRVYNDGPELPSDLDGSGIGLANVRTRLRSLYGDRGTLAIRNQSPSGVEVSVSLPYQES
jgi:two-component system, LytTR family, sensor kinase